MELPRVPNDTSSTVERRVIEGLRRLGPEQRLAQAMALCHAAEELARAGIRLREGDLPEAEVRVHLARLRYGAALVARAEAHRAKRRR